MLGLKEDNPLKMLREFSVHLNGDLIENFGAAKMTIDNQHGKGHISLYELIPGFSAWVYNIELANELIINLEFSKDRPYYFGYNVSGHQFQKFPGEKKRQVIQQNQNFIIISEPGTSSEFVVPSGIHYKCCYLIINPVQLANSKIQSKTRLLEQLKETFGEFDSKPPYRYFGDIDTRIGSYAEIIVKNSRTDIVGRLTTEGAVLNMLASQIAAHDQDNRTESFRPQLTKSELSKITDIGDYVINHISEKITMQDIMGYLSMSPKKIQAGIQYLYGSSANDYITKLRLEHAKELMHATDMSISEVCYGVGYQSRSYFSKIFKEMHGLLPSDYKKYYLNENLLFDISYRSLAVDSLTNKQVDWIVNTAREMNPEFNITGSLIFHRNIFFQIIEGPKKEVLQLYENITKDKRHTDVQIMWKGYKVKRDFEDWAMATLSDDGNLEVSIQGDTKNLELSHVLGKLDKSSLASESLWRKVRNIIKLSSDSAA
ncbi:BLUF domain-containing protein [Maribacter aestuarii]|uniref:BLUF domain-containing protein n=1 Tax=Maribacter aestuarii TaxID=1130723 RepID=UPI0025A64108|nr:BLUF domain-containing protein [Maribacter aestuarii]